MPYPLSDDFDEKVAAGRMISGLLVDLYCANESDEALTLRCWDWPGELSYPANDAIDGTDPVAYTSMYRRLRVEREVKFSAGLTSEPMRIVLDGARAGDDEDFAGQFTDAKWHQHAVRVRQVSLDLDAGTSDVMPVWQWRGRLDQRQFTRIAGQESPLTITCEGGIFRVRGRRMHTRTDVDQRRRKSTDAFFSGTPAMVSVPIIWARAPVAIGSGGSSAGGGGGGGAVPGYGPGEYMPWAQ